jgi:hypothetical protein
MWCFLTVVRFHGYRRENGCRPPLRGSQIERAQVSPGTYARLLTMTTLQERSRGLRLSRRTTDVRLRREMRVCQPKAGVGKYASIPTERNKQA